MNPAIGARIRDKICTMPKILLKVLATWLSTGTRIVMSEGRISDANAVNKGD